MINFSIRSFIEYYFSSNMIFTKISTNTNIFYAKSFKGKINGFLINNNNYAHEKFNKIHRTGSRKKYRIHKIVL